MTEKGFIKWLRSFLLETDIKNINLRGDFTPTYNHTTALKEISNKIEKIKDAKRNK